MLASVQTSYAVLPAHCNQQISNRSRCACKRPIQNSSQTAPRHGLHNPRQSPSTSFACKASKDSKEPPWQRQEGASGGSPTETENKQKETELSPQDKKGQRTAIITGFISVAFGVGYLLLVSLLDSRGGVLQPPPPEAFGQ